jgi:hypothetical protein
MMYDWIGCFYIWYGKNVGRIIISIIKTIQIFPRVFLNFWTFPDIAYNYSDYLPALCVTFLSLAGAP